MQGAGIPSPDLLRLAASPRQQRAQQGESSMASAYVFNTGSQSVTLYINQNAAGSLSGAAPMNGYAPGSANYPFNPSGGGEGAEFNAQTQVTVESIGGFAMQTYQVNASEIPPGAGYPALSLF